MMKCRGKTQFFWVREGASRPCSWAPRREDVFSQGSFLTSLRAAALAGSAAALRLFQDGKFCIFGHLFQGLGGCFR